MLLLRTFAISTLICFGELALSADFGRTEGVFNVVEGAATYNIPIWTPPGPNGLQPTISLSYNSQGGNGLAGVGWNLDAASSIERCPRTTGQDGEDGAVNINSNDKFCINGKRLRLLPNTGTYGAHDSFYFTEIADFSRIKAIGQIAGGPSSFLVEARDGLKYEYGGTANAQVFVAGALPVLRWMLNKVYDRSGNTYILTYHNETGFGVVDSIQWTPVSHGSTTYRYEAKFNYSTNRTDADSYLGRAFVYPIVNRRRLENIQIRSNGAVIRKYRFNYETSLVTERSRLKWAKECADDAEQNCFSPITFTYQTGVAGVTAGAGTPPAGSSNNLVVGRYDFNGDGKHDIAYWSASSWMVALSTSNGFAGPYNTGISGSVLVDDFLPSGRAALLTSVSGTLWTYRWDDASSTFVGSSTGVSSALPTTSLDYNGDGLSDLLYYSSGVTSLSVRANTSTGSGAATFASALASTAQLGPNRIYGGIYNYTGKGLYRADVNGDGRHDLNVLVVNTGMGGGTTRATVLQGTSIGLSVPPEIEWITGGAPNWPSIDFNDDNCTDRVVASTVVISSCNGNTGTSVAAPAQPQVLMDWDGDGRTDILVNSGGTFGVYKSTGAGFSSLISTSISSTGTFFDLDQDGDGRDDLIRLNGTNAVSYWTHTAGGTVPTFAVNIPDLLSNVADDFGVSRAVSYASTGSSHYAKGNQTPLPLQETGPAIVVAKVTSSNGIGGTFDKTYTYTGSRTNVSRGDFAGYQLIEEVDSRNGIITRLAFDQVFPKQNRLKSREIVQPVNLKTIHREEIDNDFAITNSLLWNGAYFVYPLETRSYEYEVGSSLDGNLLRTVTTTYTYDTTSGMAYNVIRGTKEPASGANGAAAGGEWFERIYTSPVYIQNDLPNWCLGRPLQIEVLNWHNLSYGSQVVRTRDLTWDTVKCRPTQTIDEPSSSSLRVVTNLGYDVFGNVSSTAVSGTGIDPRTTLASYSDSTFTTGLFPISTTNALLQTSTVVWNYDLGLPASVTDPNGITTSWQYDAFGRRIRENRPDSTYTTWDYFPCPSCDSRVRIYVDRNDRRSDGVAYHRSLQYFDQFERSIYEYSLRADGNYNTTTRNFDSLGRVINEFFPYSNNPVGFVTTAYDLINRPYTISRPKSDTDSSTQSTTIHYEGLTARIVDPQAKETTQIRNAAGQIRISRDHAGYEQIFDYDPFGNIKRIQDSATNTLQSSNYNVRGMLTSRTDMDLGTWSFTPNALGQVISQTDAKNQTTTFEFDLLGRLKKRTEAEGVSEWIWGNSNPAKNIGQLYSISGPGYSETYAYDAIGRPSSITFSADTTYQVDFSYNNIGMLDTMTYPTSTSAYRLKLQYDYQHGQLYRIRDFNSPNTNFWTANTFNARSQVTQAALGNGLVTNRIHDAVTGQLKSIQTGLGGGNGVQHIEYTWDLVGNLTRRRDYNQGSLAEEFVYDNLYRLDYSTLNGSPNLDLSYDALGNIVSKSDVGTYSYHSTKKHQVISTSNGWSFSYDNNGNMTSGRNATISWTSYNYPSSIANGSDTAAFSYTPDRQYWRQISNYTNGGAATTIYIGGILEKVTNAAGTDYKHFIRTPTANIIVSRRTDGQNLHWYTLPDHLGSNAVITTSAGAIQAQLSYDAFGKRRGANWSSAPTSSDWTNIAGVTRRGYTDHTMLDNLGLIHMNGRVQDPVIGRFISADPFIPDPLYTQDYNRYSYVTNNPLSLIDPSGFFPPTGPKPGREPRGSGKFPPATANCDGFRSMTGHCLSSVMFVPQFDPVLGLGSTMALTAAARNDPLLTGIPPTNSQPTAAWSSCINPEFAPKPITAKIGPPGPYNLYRESSRAFLNGVGELASGLGYPTEKGPDGTLVNPMTGELMTVLDRQNAVALTALSVIVAPARGAAPAVRGVHPSTPVGRTGSWRDTSQFTGNSVRSSREMQVAGARAGGSPINAPATIGGRNYSGHALDRMQERGYVPSVVEDAIGNGIRTPSYGGASSFYSPSNNLTVIVDDVTGNVVTVRGGP